MANYRRCYVPGGSYFFTVVTERRAPILANDTARDLLHSAIRACQQQWPFSVDALVLLPDHLHAIWTLPPDDCDYSKRWGFIEKYFTQQWLTARLGTNGIVVQTTPTTARHLAASLLGTRVTR